MLPAKILFYTDGVKLACNGSPIIDLLKQLESKGVELVLCKTCLDYFGLGECVEVGIVGGMPDIIEAMSKAGKVISLQLGLSMKPAIEQARRRVLFRKQGLAIFNGRDGITWVKRAPACGSMARRKAHSRRSIPASWQNRA